MSLRVKGQVWWLDPIKVLLATIGVLGFSSVLVPDEYYRAFYFAPKYIDEYYIASLVVIALALWFGGRLGAAMPAPVRDDEYRNSFFSRKDIFYVFLISSFLCMFGYVYWLFGAMRAGFSWSVILAAFQDSYVGSIKYQYFLNSRVVGLTSLTQLGVFVLVLGCNIWVSSFRRRRAVSVVLLGLMFFAFLRALLVSERLAMIELIVPFVVLYYRGKSFTRRRRLVLSLAPVIFLSTGILLFSLFEYYRSFSGGWLDSLGFGGFSLLGYGAVLFLGYYLTALNNNAMLLGAWAYPYPYFSILPWLKLSGSDTEAGVLYKELLSKMAFTGFNNTGGYLLPILDFGWFFGVAYFVFFGWLVRWAYAAFVFGSPLALLVYPFLFVCIIDLPRVNYFLEGRAIPFWIGIVLVLLVSTKRGVR
ncbi:O-antigen polymerase [Zhongshania sp.]|jgi:oligosaccharide repeat unit polymerase|uniref:O-antigen polymerase n=1 Tax=Zhongshania sp. TaxID=1971902 RepID=UPI002A821FA1|nr:O-antigen polymerase [Zhongshania sp.]